VRQTGDQKSYIIMHGQPNIKIFFIGGEKLYRGIMTGVGIYFKCGFGWFRFVLNKGKRR
jgi:hypothetical protein